jgi:hypothetical protein
MSKLHTLTIILTLFGAVDASAVCTRYCNPNVSKPCGKSCISKYNQCHKPWTTACSGTNPNSGSKPVYNTPKHVEPTSPEATGGAVKPDDGAQ